LTRLVGCLVETERISNDAAAAAYRYCISNTQAGVEITLFDLMKGF
jgi:hypothetical protein